MRLLRIGSLVLAAALISGPVVTSAAASESSYFKSIEGRWSGPGRIVAGKYKGTKFHCNFTGSNPANKAAMDIGGTCRVGMFTQKMSASISKRGRSYRGRFLDGAKGQGMDIVSGRLSGRKLIVGINRKQLNGAMVANMNNPNQMRLTISVRVGRELIPVIGITLDRKGGRTQTTALVDLDTSSR